MTFRNPPGEPIAHVEGAGWISQGHPYVGRLCERNEHFRFQKISGPLICLMSGGKLVCLVDEVLYGSRVSQCIHAGGLLDRDAHKEFLHRHFQLFAT